jgi:hypothetical protein
MCDCPHMGNRVAITWAQVACPQSPPQRSRPFSFAPPSPPNSDHKHNPSTFLIRVERNFFRRYGIYPLVIDWVRQSDSAVSPTEPRLYNHSARYCDDTRRKGGPYVRAVLWHRCSHLRISHLSVVRYDGRTSWQIHKFRYEGTL